MKHQDEAISLRRSSTSCLMTSKSNNKIIPTASSASFYTTSFSRSTSSSTMFSPQSPRESNNNNNANNSTLSLTRVSKTRRLTLTTFLKSLLHAFNFHAPPSLPTCRWLSIPSLSLPSSSPVPLGRKVTGTLFGHRKGHVTFAVQDGPRDDPALVVELAVTTSTLVREMSSGLVRIALECSAARERHVLPPRLFQEPAWTMYCNGRKCGYAGTRECTELDWHVLSTVQTVSVGAGVIPLVPDRAGSGSEGELLYMRARFERVVGSRDSEAFYMLNPDGNGGPELSIFLLRI